MHLACQWATSFSLRQGDEQVYDVLLQADQPLIFLGIYPIASSNKRP